MEAPDLGGGSQGQGMLRHEEGSRGKHPRPPLGWRTQGKKEKITSLVMGLIQVTSGFPGSVSEVRHLLSAPRTSQDPSSPS